MADTAEESDAVSRYDAILAAIPLVSLAAYVPAVVLFDGAIPARLVALAAGTAVIADALFVHSPYDS
ncbi:MAG: hypothetical protein ABEJ88_03165 [Halobacterium sp.]